MTKLIAFVIYLITIVVLVNGQTLDECLQKDSISCVQKSIYRKAKEFFDKDSLEILPGVNLVKSQDPNSEGRNARSNKDIIYDREIDSANDVAERQNLLENFVGEEASNYGKRRSSDMFKLVVLSGLLAVALAKPSAEVKPENVAQAEKATTIIAEKTIESHGHSIIHHTAPSVPLAAEGSPILPTAPLTVAEILQLPEKSEKLEGSLEKLESSQEKINASSQEILEAIHAKALLTPTKIPQKVEPPIEEKQLPDPKKSNDTKQGRQLIDLPASESLHYLVPYPLYPALTTPVVTPVVPKTINLIEKPESRPVQFVLYYT